MAEKKNRFRPTLTAYRALENENSELKEELAKYKQANGKMDTHISEAMRIEFDSLRCKNDILEKSNALMEAELKRVRLINDSLLKSVAELGTELALLKARGFWDRLLNRNLYEKLKD